MLNCLMLQELHDCVFNGQQNPNTIDFTNVQVRKEGVSLDIFYLFLQAGELRIKVYDDHKHIYKKH